MGVKVHAVFARLRAKHMNGETSIAPGGRSEGAVTSRATLWERLFVILTFITACRAFEGLLSRLSGDSGLQHLSDSTPARFAWLATLYGVGLLLLLFHHHRDLLKLASQNKLLLLVVGYVLLSSTWAFDPQASLRRGTALALTLCFCAYLALRYPPIEILKLAAWAVCIVGIVSFGAAVFDPELAVEGFGRKAGWWRGISSSNTSFGRYMALGVLIAWSLRRTDWKLQRYDVLVFGFFVFCTYKANAASSIAAVFGAYCSVLAIWSRSLFNVELPPKLLVGGLIGLLLAAILPFIYGDILLLLGRDATLTNRVFIWGAAIEQGWQRPILGAGFNSFWIENNAAGAYYNMFGSGNTRIGNGHNGYLDVWLELGFVGLGLLALIVGQAFLRVIRVLTVSDDPFAEFYAGLLVFILIHSVAEKVILVYWDLSWMLFMAGLMSLHWWFDSVSRREQTYARRRDPLQHAPQRLQ